jgi:hypothetical protein
MVDSRPNLALGIRVLGDQQVKLLNGGRVCNPASGGCSQIPLEPAKQLLFG